MDTLLDPVAAWLPHVGSLGVRYGNPMLDTVTEVLGNVNAARVDRAQCWCWPCLLLHCFFKQGCAFKISIGTSNSEVSYLQKAKPCRNGLSLRRLVDRREHFFYENLQS